MYKRQVLQTTANRMGAKLVPEYILNVTPPEQYELCLLYTSRVADSTYTAKLAISTKSKEIKV